MAAALDLITTHADRLLRHAEIQDYAGALNGLQIQNNGKVTRMAAAVDANLPVFREAVRRRVDLLLVHHGIGWSPLCPLTGGRHELIKLALDHNLAVYSSHLPLDLHPQLGNNILLAKALGLGGGKPFFFEKGNHLGRLVRKEVRREVLAARLKKVLVVQKNFIWIRAILLLTIGLPVLGFVLTAIPFSEQNMNLHVEVFFLSCKHFLDFSNFLLNHKVGLFCVDQFNRF